MDTEEKPSISVARRIYAKVHWHYNEEEKARIWYRTWLLGRARLFGTRMAVAWSGVFLVIVLTFTPQPPLVEARIIGSCMAVLGLVRFVQFAKQSHRYWDRARAVERENPDFWRSYFELISDAQSEVQEGDPSIRIEVDVPEEDMR